MLPLLLAAAGCSPAPPAYGPPTDGEATSGYIAGLLADADALASKPFAEPSDIPEETMRAVVDTAHAVEDLQRMETIRILRKTEAYDRVRATNCEWRRIDADAVEKMSAVRVTKQQPGGYRCDVEVFVTQEGGIPAKATTKGYFYRSSSGWMYVGMHAHGYERY